MMTAIKAIIVGWVLGSAIGFLITQIVSATEPTTILTKYQERVRPLVNRDVVKRGDPIQKCKDWTLSEKEQDCHTVTLYTPQVESPRNHPTLKQLNHAVEQMVYSVKK